MHIRNHEQLRTVHLVGVVRHHLTEHVFVEVDTAKRVARVGSRFVLQGCSAASRVRLFKPDRVHECHCGIWVIQGKHFAEVVLTSSLGSTATFGSVHNVDTKQTGRSHAVGRQIVVAFVEVALGQTKQGFLLHDQAAVGLEHVYLTGRFVRDGDELGVVLGFERRDKGCVGLLTSD